MPKECLTSKAFPTPRFRYSPVVKSGPLYTFAGQVARADAGTAIVPGGPGAELRHILRTLLAGIPELGLTLDDMIKVTIYTTELERMEEISAAWNEVFTESVRPPARTTIGVAKLPLGASVEVDFQFWKE